ncbi:transglutaminase family protein [Stakelama sediminis]|uniref:Transglutaminase-like putative cysteine protease n=1 Tax=Stakelama sediminis TaxID=463200 RepID=A0A840Z355_9SPHN|nr:transglutaminase family protein [Stakelama sediminis]MBB5720092.1 transglutaminase-like putative cysteine protease [Stakelama sediminis]
MLLTICHRTVYRYARPVTLQPHRMMLCPRGQHDLRLLTTLISCTPPAHIEWTQDVFGNLIATASFSEDVETLIIESRMVVEQSATAWPIFRIAPSAHSFPFSYSNEDVVDLGALREPQHDAEAGILRRWLAEFRPSAPADTLSLLKAINVQVYSRHGYISREEEGTQTPAETIRSASGSCRDLATLFIEAVRDLGFGARAVSGYLHAVQDGSGNDTIQHGSTHAWAEVYLPCAGWIPFDPTHGRMGGAGLIPVAVARNITQIPPVQGQYTGAPDDFVDMQVDVAVAAGTVLASAYDRPYPAN